MFQPTDEQVATVRAKALEIKELIGKDAFFALVDEMAWAIFYRYLDTDKLKILDRYGVPHRYMGTVSLISFPKACLKQ